MEKYFEKREFLRIEDYLPVSYFKIRKKESLKKAQRENISGGGIKLIINEKISVGTKLKLNFDLPDSIHPLTIFAEGCVVWQKEIKEDDEKKYEVGISFEKIKKEEREKILRYVLSKRRRKG
jgi:c-di-GMP-binding flagellar brake protein YcgR